VSASHIIFETDGPVAYLTFNRPEARNAMTWDMYTRLEEICERVDRAEGIRVLVLRGAGGKAFASGTDISQFATFASREDALAYERRLDGIVDRLERVTAATIAQVQGVATGGGCALALACDLRVCTPDARFGVPIARTIGNCLSAANYARMMDLMGPARVKDLLFSGRLIACGRGRSDRYGRRRAGGYACPQRAAHDSCNEGSTAANPGEPPDCR
jgi:enoyl-CoA hydratase/carnithine racemase